MINIINPKYDEYKKRSSGLPEDCIKAESNDQAGNNKDETASDQNYDKVDDDENPCERLECMFLFCSIVLLHYRKSSKCALTVICAPQQCM